MTEVRKYLSTSGVLYIHHKVIERYGGKAGVRSKPLLESSVAQPMQQFNGADLYSDLWAKAAAYAYFLCKNHPFLDGNKRTAAATMEVFLTANGYELHAPNELAEIILRIAEGEVDIPEIADWIKKNSIATEPR